MKNLINFLIYFLPFLAYSQNIDDVQIYSEIINRFDKANVIAIKEFSSVGHDKITDFEFDNYIDVIPELKEETFDNFILSNKTSDKLPKIYITKKKVIILSDEEVKNSFNGGNGWNEFYEKYGKTQGILNFSKIGYNKFKTQALLYYGNQSDWLAGGGYLMLFEKINGVWKYSQGFMMWIS